MEVNMSKEETKIFHYKHYINEFLADTNSFISRKICLSNDYLGSIQTKRLCKNTVLIVDGVKS